MRRRRSRHTTCKQSPCLPILPIAIEGAIEKLFSGASHRNGCDSGAAGMMGAAGRKSESRTGENYLIRSALLLTTTVVEVKLNISYVRS
jgi:hypothetical protein